MLAASLLSLVMGLGGSAVSMCGDLIGCGVAPEIGDLRERHRYGDFRRCVAGGPTSDVASASTAIGASAPLPSRDTSALSGLSGVPSAATASTSGEVASGRAGTPGSSTSACAGISGSASAAMSGSVISAVSAWSEASGAWGTSMSIDAVASGDGPAASGVEGSPSASWGGFQGAVELSSRSVPETNTALALTAKKDWRNRFSDTRVAGLVVSSH